MLLHKCSKCGKNMRENKSWEVYQDATGTFYNWKIEKGNLVVTNKPENVEVKKVFLGYDCYKAVFPL